MLQWKKKTTLTRPIFLYLAYLRIILVITLLLTSMDTFFSSPVLWLTYEAAIIIKPPGTQHKRIKAAAQSLKWQDVRQQPFFEWQANQSYVKNMQPCSDLTAIWGSHQELNPATHPVYTPWLFLASRNRLWSNSSRQKQDPRAPETGTNRLHTASGNDCLRPLADVRRKKTGQVGLLLEWGDAEKGPILTSQSEHRLLYGSSTLSIMMKCSLMRRST